MTRKHFELIASVLRQEFAVASPLSADQQLLFDGLVSSFANNLSDENPRFDRQRFVKACTEVQYLCQCVLSHAHQLVYRDWSRLRRKA